MTWDNKVIWSEGLFLQPQHLQQQERYLERMIRASTASLTPFGYGLTRLEIDADLLALGKFALRSAAGIMPDGTPFRIPGDDDQPEPLDLPETLRNTTLYLSLPARQPGTVDTATADRAETAARFVVSEHTAIDTSAGYQSEAVVPIGRLRFRLLTEHELTGGHVALGLIRILEVRADRSVVLDENYIPPILVTEVSARLAGELGHLQGLLHQRAEGRAGRVADTPHRGAAEVSDYLILQICNRYEVLLGHLTACIGQLHPELVYRVSSSLPATSPLSLMRAGVHRFSRPTATKTCRPLSAPSSPRSGSIVLPSMNRPRCPSPCRNAAWASVWVPSWNARWSPTQPGCWR